MTVQVQPCKEKGSVQFLLSGMDWLLDNAKRPAVVQMSLLALGASKSLNKKVDQIIDAHIPFVLSAGNYANGMWTSQATNHPTVCPVVTPLPKQCGLMMV